MTNLLLVLDILLLVILAPWFGLMSLVVIAALWRRVFGGPAWVEGPPTSRFLFVIPAHDESSVIGITVRSCLAVDYDSERFQVFVIADNCTDDTAIVAEAAGAQVMIRDDPARKSKGFALEDFFRASSKNPAIRPFDAYVLVDADTSVSGDLLRVFDQSLRRGDDFIQGYYTVRNADASWRTRMLTYAFSLTNGVWLAGLDQLGLSAGLKGNGMCFRESALERFPWQAHGLVEDMEFAWNLRIGGERVRFQPFARVFGEMVSRGGSGAASQRRRWEHGRKALRGNFRRGLWRSRHLSPMAKFAYGIELDFPPISRLAVGLGVASILGALGSWIGSPRPSSNTILIGLAAYWTTFVSYALSPIFTIKLPIRYLFSLIYLPYFIVWKLFIGLSKKTEQWVRTPREAAPTTNSQL